ncbi:DUF1378 family protein [Escherichia coli]|uniref:DUF1378 family protein n=1 Tax=Escherichia coli TaxID=562 RepID=A0A8S7R672_ECOLX|nr:DUF1378 family protein [Escherichia coli]EEQ4721336.1 DUF1378 family protein [Escherichia coli]EEU4414598.1 DUF1378 family protein [Escherichia coli]EFH0367815.1 DUF1378 family protein [Escherichia coli]EFH4416640.1 DUF1378 family protein [Escherichia coli]EGK2889633.1 DUF1378 family protein [Escherichia coli]
MTFLQLILLYFCTTVCVLYLVSGGYKIIRNYIRKKIDAMAAEKISTGQSAESKAPPIP